MSNIEIYCPICGLPFNPTQRKPEVGGPMFSKGAALPLLVCSKACFDEAEWRNVLVVNRKDYYPQPSRPYYQEETQEDFVPDIGLLFVMSLLSAVQNRMNQKVPHNSGYPGEDPEEALLARLKKDEKTNDGS